MLEACRVAGVGIWASVLGGRPPNPQSPTPNPHPSPASSSASIPPTSAEGDACGIVVCVIDREGTLHVLADHSAKGLGPEAWARRVAAAAEQWGATLVVAEKNQGGEMVGSVLRGLDAGLPVRLVNAGLGEAARAEPVALRFETGRAKLAGSFPELEDELCAMTYGGYEGEGSPDRADATVWAMTELVKPHREPRVRGI